MAQKIDPDARFERLKKQASREIKGQQQEARGALARRFAAQGMTGSGAQLKLEQQINRQGQGALARRLGDIENLQESEALKRQETKEARDFAKRERQASQDFSKEALNLQQNFQARQNYLSRGLQQRAMNIQESQFGKQMELAREQFDLDKLVTMANLDLAKAEANKKGLMERLGSISTGDLFKGSNAGTGAILGTIVGGPIAGVGGAIFGSATDSDSKLNPKNWRL